MTTGGRRYKRKTRRVRKTRRGRRRSMRRRRQHGGGGPVNLGGASHQTAPAPITVSAHEIPIPTRGAGAALRSGQQTP